MFTRKKRWLILLLALLAGLLLASCSTAPVSGVVTKGHVIVKLKEGYDPRTSNIKDKWVVVAREGELYTNKATDNSTIDPNHQLDQDTAYALVGPKQGEGGVLIPQLGIYGNEILPPGPYPEIPTGDVQIVEAAVIPPGWVGLYADLTQNPPIYQVLQTGDESKPKSMVTMYPATVQRYRTLRPSTLEEVIATKDAAKKCASIVCEASIDNVALAGTQVMGTVDVEINFRFLTQPKDAGRLRELGSPENAIQAFLSPIRGIVRSSTHYTPEQLQDPQIKADIVQAYKEGLKPYIEGQPIVIESIVLRSTTVGSEEYQKAIEDSQRRINEEKANAEKIRLEQNSLAAQQALQKSKNDFARVEEQANAEAKSRAIETIMSPLRGLPWQTVAVIFKVLDINSVVNLDGSGVGPVLTPAATPAPTQ